MKINSISLYGAMPNYYPSQKASNIAFSAAKKVQPQFPPTESPRKIYTNLLKRFGEPIHTKVNVSDVDTTISRFSDGTVFFTKNTEKYELKPSHRIPSLQTNIQTPNSLDIQRNTYMISFPDGEVRKYGNYSVNMPDKATISERIFPVKRN